MENRAGDRPELDAPVMPAAEPTGRWRRWTVPGLAVVLVLAVGVLGWTWRHPDRFVAGDPWGLRYKELTPGRALYVGITFPQPGANDVITIHAVRANVTGQSGRLEVAALVCSLRSTAESAAGSGDEAMVRDLCASLVPAEGETMHLGRERSEQQQLVVAVTARGQARVVIDGINVTYSSGWQRGTQRVGGTLELSTKDGQGSFASRT